MATCEACHQEITDPAELVRAVEVIHEQSVGGEPVEPVEGRTLTFHREHFPDDPSRYRRIG